MLAVYFILATLNLAVLVYFLVKLSAIAENFVSLQEKHNRLASSFQAHLREHQKEVDRNFKARVDQQKKVSGLW